LEIINKQTNYWNEFAGKKEFTSNLDKEYFVKNIHLNSIILDYGCGYGRTIKELIDCGYSNLIGVDIAEQMLELSKSKFPQLQFEKLINQATTLANASCDTILLLNTLTAITEDLGQKNTINEISRLLKQGGILYLTDFLLNSDERNLNRYAKYQDKYKTYGIFETEDGAILRHQDKQNLIGLLSDFEIKSIQEMIVQTMNGNKSNAVAIIAKKK